MDVTSPDSQLLLACICMLLGDLLVIYYASISSSRPLVAENLLEALF